MLSLCSCAQTMIPYTCKFSLCTKKSYYIFVACVLKLLLCISLSYLHGLLHSHQGSLKAWCECGYCWLTRWLPDQYHSYGTGTRRGWAKALGQQLHCRACCLCTWTLARLTRKHKKGLRWKNSKQKETKKTQWKHCLWHTMLMDCGVVWDDHNLELAVLHRVANWVQMGNGGKLAAVLA